LPVDMLLELRHPLLANTFGLGVMDNTGHGIDRHFVDMELEFDDVGGTIPSIFVIERSIALGGTLKLSEEIVDQTLEREEVLDDNLCSSEE